MISNWSYIDTECFFDIQAKRSATLHHRNRGLKRSYITQYHLTAMSVFCEPAALLRRIWIRYHISCGRAFGNHLVQSNAHTAAAWLGQYDFVWHVFTKNCKNIKKKIVWLTRAMLWLLSLLDEHSSESSTFLFHHSHVLNIIHTSEFNIHYFCWYNYDWSILIPISLD